MAPLSIMAFTQPIFVTKIEDKQGKVIYQAIPDRKSAINPFVYNAIMVDMLPQCQR